jgi:hypothetical protein
MSEISLDELRQASQQVLEGTTSIEAEGAKHSLADLAATLRRTRQQLQEIADTWSQEQLRTRPPEGSARDDGEDRWSATEAISHLIATENWYRLHMWRLRGEKRMFDVMVRGLGDLARNDVPKEQLSAQLREATQTLLEEIASIPADADIAAQRDSTFFGMLSLRGWVYLAINHDLMHLAQIERLKTYPHFPAA